MRKTGARGLDFTESHTETTGRSDEQGTLIGEAVVDPTTISATNRRSCFSHGRPSLFRDRSRGAKPKKYDEMNNQLSITAEQLPEDPMDQLLQILMARPNRNKSEVETVRFSTTKLNRRGKVI